MASATPAVIWATTKTRRARMPDRIKYPLPPWKVMPDPDNKGRHVFHDHRWIATADAEVECGYDSRSWGLSKGSLICEMRDLDPEAAHRIVDCVNACNGLNPAAVATMPETLSNASLGLSAVATLLDEGKQAAAKQLLAGIWRAVEKASTKLTED